MTIATVVVTARCLVPGCGWTASGKGADLAARKHTDTGHATVTEGTVAR